MWFSITEINHLTNLNQGKTKNSYCLEVLDDSLEPIYMLGNGIYTHNCRLRLDLRELRKKSGGYFGSGESTGSIGVVTINMPRIAYLSTDKADFYARLDRLMDISARSLKVKRETVTKLLEAGLYPYTKHYLGSFKNHFSTIGLVGMNEACLNARWIKKDLTNKEAQEFTVEVLNHMRERLSDYQEAYGDLYNLEATHLLNQLLSVLLSTTRLDTQISSPLLKMEIPHSIPTLLTYQLAIPPISSKLLILKINSRPYIHQELSSMLS